MLRDDLQIRVCQGCGASFEEAKRVGSPRRYCPSCGGGDSNSGWQKKARMLRLRYGLPAHVFKEMEERAGGRCEACGEPPDENGLTVSARSLHVDHNHETGATRGLICSPCNLALGWAKEDPDRLEALARYLRSYQEVLV